MREPIENEYFNWLCAKVLYTQGPMYKDLLAILYRTPFEWSVFGDKNRAEDGLELRLEFLRQAQMENDDHLWYTQPCSVLEVFLAFAQKAEFQTDIEYRTWFWEFLQNLGLERYQWMNNPETHDTEVRIVGNILKKFMKRRYNQTGHGGMFPMRWPQHDQREVEIWYQFCEYLDEKGLV